MTDTATLDHICRTRTGFTSFADLLQSHPSYRPSIEQAAPEMVTLADAYDAAMEGMGDSRRAYRYGQPKHNPAPPPIAPRPGTTIIGGIHATLWFDVERDGSVVSSCHLTRNGQSCSLALAEDMGGIDGDDQFIAIPERVIDRITDWAVARGY